MKPRRLQSETSTSMFTGLPRRSSRSSAFSRKALDLAHEARRSHRLADEQGNLAIEELTELAFGTAQSHPDRLVPGQTAQAPERRDAPAPESQEAGHRVRARLAHEATGLHVHDQWPASEDIASATAHARVDAQPMTERIHQPHSEDDGYPPARRARLEGLQRSEQETVHGDLGVALGRQAPHARGPPRPRAAPVDFRSPAD